MIIGTCGHEITDGLGYGVAVKDYARDGGKCISHKTVCLKCYQVYMASDDLVMSDEERDEYFAS